MATEDIVGGLFGVNPAMYQQQQQQQVFNRAVALQNLDPFQQAAVGYQQAGYNLAGALGGALGGVDPQLQRISALNAISKQIDQSSPESMMSGAKMLADAGFTQEALGLAQYARKANSELALAKQRMDEGRAAAIPKDVQIAEYAANLRVVLGELELGPQNADTLRQIALIKARLDALPQPKETTSTDAIRNATAIADASGFTKGTTEYNKVYKDALTGLTAKAGKEEASTNEIRNALAIADASGFAKGTPEYSKAYKDALAALTAKPGKEASSTEAIKNALALADASGYAKDSPEYNKAYKDALTELTGKSGKADATTNEIRNALAFADLSGFAKDTPEYNKVFKDELVRLTTKSAAAADKANIAEIGVSPKGDAVYFDKNTDQQFIVKIEGDKTVRVPYAGSVNRATSNVSASATATGAKQEEAFSVQRGKDQAAALAEAATLARAASQALTTISTMKQLDKTGQLVTGPLANSYVGASNLLASIGLLSANQVSILTSSQVYDKSAKDLVMQDLGGKLGAQISDADRKFVEDRIPQLTTSAKARTELLDKIEQIQKGKIAYYDKMNKYANKNTNLNGFDFSEVYTVTPPVGSPAASSVKSKADAIIKGNP